MASWYWPETRRASRTSAVCPAIFDWAALREVERYVSRTTESSRPYARVIMSDKARESKIDDAGLRLLVNLEQRNAVELCHI